MSHWEPFAKGTEGVYSALAVRAKQRPFQNDTHLLADGYLVSDQGLTRQIRAVRSGRARGGKSDDRL